MLIRFSLESEWQVFLGLQDSSQYPSWSNNAVVWMVLILPISNPSPPFQALGNCSKCISYNWYHYHSCFTARSKYLSLFGFYIFTVVHWDCQVHYMPGLFFFVFFFLFVCLLIITRCGLLSRIRWSVYISKSQIGTVTWNYILIDFDTK